MRLPLTVQDIGEAALDWYIIGKQEHQLVNFLSYELPVYGKFTSECQNFMSCTIDVILPPYKCEFRSA